MFIRITKTRKLNLKLCNILLFVPIVLLSVRKMNKIYFCWMVSFDILICLVFVAGLVLNWVRDLLGCGVEFHPPTRNVVKIRRQLEDTVF